MERQNSKLLPAFALLLALGLLPASAQVFTNLNAGGLQGVFLSSSVAGDFDGDGKMDLLYNGTTGSYILANVWRNSGNGNFSDFANLWYQDNGAYSGQVAVGDFYNSGRIDALDTGIGSASNGAFVAVSQLWHNLGGGNFNLITNSGLPGIVFGNVAIGDFYNDGKLDLALSGYTNAGGSGIPISQVWRNLGNGVFTKVNIGLPRAIETMVAADFDNDGYLDILAGTTLWRNLGNGTFSNIASGIPGGVVAIGDFDNDGYLDVLGGQWHFSGLA